MFLQTNELVFFTDRSGDLSLEIPLRLFEYIGMEDDMSPWFAFADEMKNLQNLLYTDPIYGQFQVGYVCIISCHHIF